MTNKEQTLIDLRHQLWFAWCAPVVAVGWFVGFFFIAKLFPPLSPALGPEEVKAYYMRDPTFLHIGLCLMMMVTPLIMPVYVAIGAQLKRILGEKSVLAHAQLALGLVMPLFFIFPAFDLGNAAFRPERSAEHIQVLSDGAWLPFVSGFQTTVWSWFFIGVAILCDKEERIFPRWLGHFNFWNAAVQLLAGFTFFTKTGPFAWNGVLALWTVAVSFQAWFLGMFWMVRKNILKQMEEVRSAV